MQKDVEQQIKQTAQIADVVGHFVNLKKTGSRLTAPCPFHDERTPSFYVTPSQGIYKCFGCGKGGDAVSFVMEYTKCTYPEALQTIASIYNITTDGRPSAAPHRLPQRLFAAPVAPPPSYFPKSLFNQSLKVYAKNNFAAFLGKRFGADTAAAMVGRYLVGTAAKWPGANVFWYMDCGRRVRSGKIMLYDSETGKRSRSNAPTWAHKATPNGQNDFTFVRCFFGEHLLPKHPTAPVCIVESEKTAIIASLYIPDVVWLAVGGQSFPTDWQPLNGRTVTLFPDTDTPAANGTSPFTIWQQQADKMRKAGFSVCVSDLLEQRATPEQRAAKWDLADYLLQFNVDDFLAATVRPQATNARPITTAPGNEALATFGFKAFCREPFTDHDTPRTTTAAPEWTALTDLKTFFSITDLPAGPVQIAPAQTITNPAAFIEAHLATCEANNGSRHALPYLERLKMFKDILSETKSTETKEPTARN